MSVDNAKLNILNIKWMIGDEKFLLSKAIWSKIVFYTGKIDEIQFSMSFWNRVKMQLYWCKKCSISLENGFHQWCWICTLGSSHYIWNQWLHILTFAISYNKRNMYGFFFYSEHFTGHEFNICAAPGCTSINSTLSLVSHVLTLNFPVGSWKALLKKNFSIQMIGIKKRILFSYLAMV